MKKFYTLIVFFNLSLLLAQQPGDLDISFGTNGKVVANFSNASFNVKSQAVQTDGKLILVGEINSGLSTKGFIFRLNADGSLDTTFNTTGRVVHSFIDIFEIVKLQSDGKILVGGTYNNDVAIARYNANGTLDAGFALSGNFYNSDINNPPTSQKTINDLEIQTDGKILGLTTLDVVAGERDYIVFRLLANGIEDTSFLIVDGFGEFVFPESLNIQTNGKIIVSGNYTDTIDRMFISSYNADGSDDTTFNITGKQIINLTGPTATKLTDVCLQTDGKIVLSGKYNNSGTALFLIRLNTNGTFDTTFSGDGLAGVTVNTGFNQNNNSRVVVQPDGKIVIMDYRENTTTYMTDIVLVRFTTTGTLDTTFNSSGGLFLSFYSNNDVGADISIVNDKIIVSGNTEEFFYKDRMAVAKINVSNGSYDTTFDLDGKYTFNSIYEGFDENIKSIVLANGKILTIGSVYANNNYFPSLVKFNANGSVDTTFGENGRVVYDLFAGGFNDLVEDSNGKILIGGYNFGTGFILIRTDQNGLLDTTFGVNGVADLSISGSFGGELNAIRVMSDGKIIAAGHNYYNNNDGRDFILMKLNANGTYDTSFGINGVSNVGSTGMSESINSIEILSDNKIIALGIIEISSGVYVAEVLKYNTIGLLDPTFNGNGRLNTNTTVEIYAKTDIALQNDGKILATFENSDSNNNFLLYRINSNGTYDTTFDFDGLVETYVEGNDASNSIYYDATSGKIVLAGTVTNATNSNFGLVRYNSDGTTDSTFGNFGIVITDFNNSGDFVSKCNITSDGKLIVTGTLFDEPNSILNHIMAKYHLEEVLSSSIFSNYNAKITFYPNPTKDFLNINFPEGLLNNREYVIYDLNGKTVLKNKLKEDNKIDVTNLNNGIYFINIANQNSIKFIKE